MYKSHIKFLAAAVISISVVSCGKKEAAPPSAQARQMRAPEVDGFVVRHQSISDKIEVPGSLMAAEQTQIRSEVNGRIVKLNITEGSTVQKGALLVKLFDGDLQAQLKKLKVQLAIAKTTEERQRQLLEIQGISQQDYDLVKLNVETLEVDIEATQIAIVKTEIRAPYSGQLGLRSVSLGAYISPQQTIASIQQLNKVKIDFTVPEKYSSQIVKGSKINFFIDGNEKPFSADVLATESAVDVNTRTLMIRALADNSNAAFNAF